MCLQCKLKPVYEFTNKRKLCRICFIKYFQKKVLYIIRKFEMIKKNDVIGYRGKKDTASLHSRHENLPQYIIGYENFGGFRSVVLEDVLKMVGEKAMVEVVKLPSNTPRVYTASLHSRHENLSRGPEKFSTKTFTKGKKINKIAIPSTIDLEADKIIHTLIKGNVKDLKNIAPVNNKVIKPLYLFLDEEVLLYAKLKKLKYKDVKEKKDAISLFIDRLEKKHPEVKRAIVNGCLGLG